MASCHFLASARSSPLFEKDGSSILLILANKLKRLFKVIFLSIPSKIHPIKKGRLPPDSLSNYLSFYTSQMKKMRTDKITYIKIFASVIIALNFRFLIALLIRL